jgi:hypothetical protein
MSRLRPSARTAASRTQRLRSVSRSINTGNASSAPVTASILMASARRQGVRRWTERNSTSIAPTCRSHSSVCSRSSGDAASSRSIMIEAAIGRSSSLRRSSTGLVRRQLVRSVLELRVLLPSRYSRRRLRHHMSKLRVLESSCPGFEVFRSGRPWYSGS